jgi:hypothetical protein
MAVTINYNETTFMVGSSTQVSWGKPMQLRLEGVVNSAFDGFVNAKMGARAFEYASSLVGIKEMPRLAGLIVFVCDFIYVCMYIRACMYGWNTYIHTCLGTTTCHISLHHGSF